MSINKIGFCIANDTKAKYNASYKEHREMDSFVYKCRKQKVKVRNEVSFPKLAGAIISKAMASRKSPTRST